VDAVAKPDLEAQNMKVKIRRRKGMEEVKWTFEAGAPSPWTEDMDDYT
jgi:hypothetical protein